MCVHIYREVAAFLSFLQHSAWNEAAAPIQINHAECGVAGLPGGVRRCPSPWRMQHDGVHAQRAPHPPRALRLVHPGSQTRRRAARRPQAVRQGGSRCRPGQQGQPQRSLQGWSFGLV
ncbi:uncharacterized protein LOC122252758 [Penaeus japonicus]|uniref:uncharacterized protein LOC122252758 n=1 Tax=Penaeus japonicus TaxID=27405 RepID=UPI001C714FE3|nr:uncharacterized protein LOC122252758 [Penaeus japonicus]